ncbi:YSIRK-type signal peptide-containing protein [Aerococcaceae bacterium zg-BR9]|uniref:lectin-like domain-containing protein n=1 Tax=Aerococcaceae bacterium zg-1292 TaxID=2774330 RepID=UPI00406306EC|nr:YSIRK-type signal peptide-containing protein [Aerococcaceae bacterium zg-BR9]
MNYKQKDRFSIRKFKVGVGSVFLGSFLLMAPQVLAEETANVNPEAENVAAYLAKSDADEDVQPEMQTSNSITEENATKEVKQAEEEEKAPLNEAENSENNATDTENPVIAKTNDIKEETTGTTADASVKEADETGRSSSESGATTPKYELGSAEYNPKAKLNVTKANMNNHFVKGGTAKYDKENRVTLTEDTHSQAGSLTLKHKIDMNESFTLKGKINLGNKYEGKPDGKKVGGDGIAAVFTTAEPGKVGQSGAGIGLSGIPNSFGFKLDTFHNTSRPSRKQKASADPKFDGYQNGAFGAFYSTDAKGKANTEKSEAKRLDKQPENNQFQDYTVSYNGVTKEMTVEYGGQKFTKKITDYLAASRKTTNQDAGKELLSFALFASTGTGTNLQQFDLESFEYTTGGSLIKLRQVDDETGEVIAEKLFEKTTEDSLDLLNNHGLADYEYKRSNVTTAKGFKTGEEVSFLPGIQTITYSYKKVEKAELKKLIVEDTILKQKPTYTLAEQDDKNSYDESIQQGKATFKNTSVTQATVDESVQKIKEAITKLKSSSAQAAVTAAEKAGVDASAKKKVVEADGKITEDENKEINDLNGTISAKKAVATTLVNDLQEGEEKTTLMNRLSNVNTVIVISKIDTDAIAIAEASVQAAEAAGQAGLEKKKEAEADEVIDEKDKAEIDKLNEATTQSKLAAKELVDKVTDKEKKADFNRRLDAVQTADSTLNDLNKNGIPDKEDEAFAEKAVEIAEDVQNKVNAKKDEAERDNIVSSSEKKVIDDLNEDLEAKKGTATAVVATLPNGEKKNELNERLAKLKKAEVTVNDNENDIQTKRDNKPSTPDESERPNDAETPEPPKTPEPPIKPEVPEPGNPSEPEVPKEEAPGKPEDGQKDEPKDGSDEQPQDTPKGNGEDQPEDHPEDNQNDNTDDKQENQPKEDGKNEENPNGETEQQPEDGKNDDSDGKSDDTSKDDGNVTPEDNGKGQQDEKPNDDQNGNSEDESNGKDNQKPESKGEDKPNNDSNDEPESNHEDDPNNDSKGESDDNTKGDGTVKPEDNENNRPDEHPNGNTEDKPKVDEEDKQDGKPKDDAANKIIVEGTPKAVKPSDKPQDTGIVIKNAGQKTNVTAIDETGKRLSVASGQEGQVLVIPGKDAKGTIKLTVTNPDLPDGEKEFTIPIKAIPEVKPEEIPEQNPEGNAEDKPGDGKQDEPKGDAEGKPGDAPGTTPDEKPEQNPEGDGEGKQEETPEDGQKDDSEDKGENQPEQRPEDTPKSDAENDGKVKPQDNPKGDSEDQPKDGKQDEPKGDEDKPKDTPEEQPEQKPEQNPEGDGEGKQEETPEDDQKGDSEGKEDGKNDNPKDDSKDQPEDGQKDDSEDKGENKPEQRPEDTPKGDDENDGKVKPQDNPKGDEEDTPKVNPEEKPEDKPEQKPEQKPEENPEQKPEGDGKGKQEDDSKGKPEQRPEDTPKGDAENDRKVKPQDNPKGDAEDTPKVNPEDKPEQKPEGDGKGKPEQTPEVDQKGNTEGKEDGKKDTPEVTTKTYVDPTTKVSVTVTGKDAEEDLKLNVVPISSSILGNKLDKQLAGKTLDMYDIFFTNKAGKRVQITNPAVVSIPRDTNKMIEGTYYVATTGLAESLPFKLTEGAVQFTATHFSYYTIAYKTKVKSEVKPEVKPEVKSEVKPEVKSEAKPKVKSETPEKSGNSETTKTPEKPTESGQSTPEQPGQSNGEVNKSAGLPNTGESSTMFGWSAAALSILVGLGLVATSNKKEDEEA